MSAQAMLSSFQNYIPLLDQFRLPHVMPLVKPLYIKVHALLYKVMNIFLC
jgi:hypothetical protein